MTLKQRGGSGDESAGTKDVDRKLRCTFRVPSSYKLRVLILRSASDEKPIGFEDCPATAAVRWRPCCSAQPAAALDADYWRGGWRTPLGDEPHIYEFVIRGQRVTGVYCRNCSDATTIGFIDGTWNEKAGIDFTVTFANPDGRIRSVDKQHAMLADGRLIVTGSAGKRNGIALTLVKDPRGADPGGAPAYHLPPGTPPALPTRPAGGGGGGGWRARALLAARAVQGVAAGGHRRHVDRPVRPGHGQADLHVSPGRRPASRRGVRPLRQHLHDWGDGERLHRRRHACTSTSCTRTGARAIRRPSGGISWPGSCRTR